MRLLIAFFLAALAGCDPGSSCSANFPLDCGTTCCPSGFAYLCVNPGKCYPTQPPATAACGSVTTCAGTGSSTGLCAHWSCGTSSQCATVMGAPSGVQCTFAAGQSCQQWCQIYIPGNCTCS